MRVPSTAAANALLFLIFCCVLCVSRAGGEGRVGAAAAVEACITRKSCADTKLLNQTLVLNSDPVCIVSQILSTTPCVFSSSLVVHHQDAIPNSQAWARCRSCFWHRDHFQVIRDGETSTEVADLSWSYWGEFFHFEGHNDRLQALILSFKSDNLLSVERNRALFQDTYVIDRPVFYIPIIAFHYGHLLIDVLQQVYGAMMEAYGEVRLDALLLLDTANQAQREDLQTVLDSFGMTNQQGGHFSVLLRWLTSEPIMSVSHLLKGRRVLFTDIHLGGDLRHSFFSSGMMRQPCHFASSDRHVQRLAAQYKAFRDHLWRQYLPAEWLVLSDEEKMFSPSSPAEWEGLFIQRRGTRMILNLPALLDRTRELSLRSEVIDLDGMSFLGQLEFLHFTACVVAVAGTATHNMLFMRPGSTMVIIMQPEWCEWSWMYVNQGILLGITVHVLCDEQERAGGLFPGTRSRHSSFVNKFWKQGAGVVAKALACLSACIGVLLGH